VANSGAKRKEWVRLLAMCGASVAGFGAVTAIVLSSGWLSDFGIRFPWLWWLYWSCAGLSGLAAALAIWTYALAPEKRQPQLVIMGFLRGDNPQPVVGFVAFVLLLYGVDLVSSLVEGGAVWWRTVAAVCATVDVSLGATLLVLYRANRPLPVDQLETTPILVCPLSRPTGWTIDDLSKAPAESLLMNTFMSQAQHDGSWSVVPKPADLHGSSDPRRASINVLFAAVGFHARDLQDVHILVTTEVAKDLGKQGIRPFDPDSSLQTVLQAKVNEVAELSGRKTTDVVMVTVHRCETGNDLSLFRESVEHELSGVFRTHKRAPRLVTFELTNGTAIITAALLLTAIKHGCQAEYLPQQNSDALQSIAVPHMVPTTIGSIYDLAEPLMQGLSSE